MQKQGPQARASLVPQGGSELTAAAPKATTISDSAMECLMRSSLRGSAERSGVGDVRLLGG